MIETRPAWWDFLPREGERPAPADAEDRERLFAGEIAAGQGMRARALRRTRARFGAARCAGLLRAALPNNAALPGRPFALLLVAAQQPRALVDALTVALAIAGLSPTIRTIEGLPALKDALDDRRAAVFDAIDLTLLVFPYRGPARPSEEAGGLLPLATAVAGRSLAPVAIASLDGGAEPDVREPALGVFELVLPLSADQAFDERFAASFGSFLAPAAADRLADAVAGLGARLAGTAPKLVVTDLDGTLIDGVLGEATSLPPFHDPYANALAVLSGRGLILGLATRNDPSDIAPLFDGTSSGEVGLCLESFADIAAGWDDKAMLVATLIARLGIAPEHVLFIDDDPVNCAKVAARFAEMDVRRFSGGAAPFAAALLGDPLLTGGRGQIGAAGVTRTEAYRRKAAVERLRSETPDISAFLERLETRVTIHAPTQALLPRAAELISRVNQFIFTDWRPSLSALAARSSPLDALFALDDAFGAHGIVALLLASIEDDRVVIDNLALSCRALERGIETAILHVLSQRAIDAGLTSMAARIDVLPRNAPARSCLAAHGFSERDGTWFYDLTERGALPRPSGVAIVST